MEKNNLVQIPCPICRSNQYKILYKSTLTSKDFSHKAITQHLKNTLDNYTKHGQIVKCSLCNIVYINPREDVQSFIQAYADVVDEECLKNEEFRKILSLKHLNNLKK